MKKEPIVSSAELRKRHFEEAQKAVGREVDEVIAQIDAGSSQEAVDSAEIAVNEGSSRVESLATEWLYGDLQESLGEAASTAVHINEMVVERDAVRNLLNVLPVAGGVQMVLALFYLFGAAVAFFTELKLTDSLVDLLGYRRDDPIGRAIGAAFASSLLVFDLIFARLGLLQEIWPLFQSTEASSDQKAHAGHRRLVRALGGVVLVLTAVAIASLQVLTVVKMAPTRPIDAAIQREHRDLTPRENQTVEASTLFFSVCVLISGGYMAAAGTRELSLCLRRKKLEDREAWLERNRLNAINVHEKTEKPRMAVALESAGLPWLWLSAVKAGEMTEQLKSLIGAMPGLEKNLPASALPAVTAMARMFGSSKRIALSGARMKPPQKRPQKSWREIVDDTIRTTV